jgi:hypothetical protein
MIRSQKFKKRFNNLNKKKREWVLTLNLFHTLTANQHQI